MPYHTDQVWFCLEHKRWSLRRWQRFDSERILLKTNDTDTASVSGSKALFVVQIFSVWLSSFLPRPKEIIIVSCFVINGSYQIIPGIIWNFRNRVSTEMMILIKRDQGFIHHTVDLLCLGELIGWSLWDTCSFHIQYLNDSISTLFMSACLYVSVSAAFSLLYISCFRRTVARLLMIMLFSCVCYLSLHNHLLFSTSCSMFIHENLFLNSFLFILIFPSLPVHFLSYSKVGKSKKVSTI